MQQTRFTALSKADEQTQDTVLPKATCAGTGEATDTPRVTHESRNWTTHDLCLDYARQADGREAQKHRFRRSIKHIAQELATTDIYQSLQHLVGSVPLACTEIAPAPRWRPKRATEA